MSGELHHEQEEQEKLRDPVSEGMSHRGGCRTNIITLHEMLVSKKEEIVRFIN